MNNVKKEFELYEPMGIWLKQYLTDKYKGYSIIVEDTSQVSLDKILEKYGIVDQYPQTVGLDIQIDVLGIVTKGGKSSEEGKTQSSSSRTVMGILQIM